jgi:hypothetical protein
MKPRLRKLALTAHVVSSVGWFGAVAAFFALAVTGVSSRDPQIARAAYLAMDVTMRLVIVPFALASLLTGIIQSLGTPWGLFRYYWVVLKFLITLLSALLVLVHTRPIGMLAELAREKPMAAAGMHHHLQVQMLADSAAALLILLIATALAVYKPLGMTRFGRRKLAEQRAAPST